MEKLIALLFNSAQTTNTNLQASKKADDDSSLFNFSNNPIKTADNDDEYTLEVLNNDSNSLQNKAEEIQDKYNLSDDLAVLSIQNNLTDEQIELMQTSPDGFTDEMKVFMAKHNINTTIDLCQEAPYCTLDYSNPKYEQLGKDLMKQYEIAQKVKSDPSMKNASDNEIQNEINKQAQDYLIQEFENSTEAIATLNAGDVFALQGKNNVFIKLSDTKSYELNITSETYAKLFPLVKRCEVNQGELGDCYALATIMSMMDKPDTKAMLLSCFSEDEQGNIKIALPKGIDRNHDGQTDFSITLGKDKEIDDLTLDVSKTELSDSALGVQLLEYSILLNRAYAKNTNLKDDNVSTEDNDNNLDNMFQQAKNAGGNGGVPSEVYKLFGLNSENIFVNSDDFESKMQNQDNLIATVSSVKNPTNSTITSNHAYEVTKTEDESGNTLYKITNPWGAYKAWQAESEQYLASEDMIDNFNYFSIADYKDLSNSLSLSDKCHYIGTDNEEQLHKSDFNTISDDVAKYITVDDSNTLSLQLGANSGIDCPWNLVKKLLPDEKYSPELYNKILSAANQEDPFTREHYSTKLQLTSELANLLNLYSL